MIPERAQLIAKIEDALRAAEKCGDSMTIYLLSMALEEAGGDPYIHKLPSSPVPKIRPTD